MSCLKRVIVITWSKLIIACLAVILFGVIIFVKESGLGNAIQTSTNQHDPYKTYFEPERPPQGSLEELYQDVFMTMLLPYIQEAVNNYYEKNTGYSPGVDPWQPDILSIERPNGYRTFLFIIKLEVAPYLGAHNSIGVDHITIKVSSGEVKVLEYKHIKDYPIPPWLQKN